MAALLKRISFGPSLKIMSAFAKSGPSSVRCIHSAKYPLQFQSTPILLAEPLKKKKRMDPAIVRMREDRRKRRIEKNIRKLEKSAKTAKPIEECEISPALKKELPLRQRNTVPISQEEMDYRDKLGRFWAVYKQQQHIEEMKTLDKLIINQDKALKALKEESLELYQEAIKVDETLITYKFSGPVYTPPMKGYEVPDGEYNDVTKQWK